MLIPRITPSVGRHIKPTRHPAALKLLELTATLHLHTPEIRKLKHPSPEVDRLIQSYLAEMDQRTVPAVQSAAHGIFVNNPLKLEHVGACISQGHMYSPPKGSCTHSPFCPRVFGACAADVIGMVSRPSISRPAPFPCFSHVLMAVAPPCHDPASNVYTLVCIHVPCVSLVPCRTMTTRW